MSPTLVRIPPAEANEVAIFPFQPRLLFRAKLSLAMTILILACVGLVVELSASYLEDELTAQVQITNLQTARALRGKISLELQAVALQSEYLLGLPEWSALEGLEREGSKSIICLGTIAPFANRILCRPSVGAKRSALAAAIGAAGTADLPQRVHLRRLPPEEGAFLLLVPTPNGAFRFVLVNGAGFTDGLPADAYAALIVDAAGDVLLAGGRGAVIPDARKYPPIRAMLERPIRNMQMRFEHNGSVFFGAFAADREIGLGVIIDVPDTYALESVSRLRRRGTYVLVVVGGIAALFTLLLAWGMTRPLGRLTKAAARIEQGDYSPDLGRPGADEVGILTRAFTAMVSGIQRNEATIRHQALHDVLTGLANRTLLHEGLPGLLAAAQRKGEHLCVCFLDLDRFKNVNDSLGHEAGDRVLCEIADRLRTRITSPNMIVRLGGDEFALAAADVGEREAMVLADQVMDCFADPVLLGNTEVHMSASMGIALYPHDGEDMSTLLKNADTAMFIAKKRSGPAYAFYTETMNNRAARRLDLETKLHHAIERGEVQVHYQPRVTPRDGAIRGLEALARWFPKDGSAITPDEFIPLAEEPGLIVTLGEWILDQAVRRAAALNATLPPEARPQMAVNVSAKQLRLHDLAHRSQRILALHNVPPSQLEIEVTESVLVEDTERAQSILQEIRALGIGVALDDFGTRYASLAYVRQFPVDILKIDSTFVKGTPGDRRDVAIVNSVVALARGLGLKTIAEGVETHDQVAFLVRAGCDEVQGFYYYKPMPGDQLARLSFGGTNLGAPGM